MLSKAVSGIMLILLLIGMLFSPINIKTAKSTWTGTIYIRADGSIDPPNAPIITYDNVTYVLTGNITSSADGIVVERDNIVIDGAGYTIQGNEEEQYAGIRLSGRRNVTIKNMIIIAFDDGISLKYSSNNTISGNNIEANIFDGISIYNSAENIISGNNIVANDISGIYFFHSSYNTILKNNLTLNNRHGLYLEESWKNIISRNNIANSPSGVILRTESNHNVLSENNITNNEYGIHSDSSSNYNIISGNNITANMRYGILLYYSSNNEIYHNNFIDNVQQVSIEASTNVWDDGYPSGGNYWSDYAGVDANGDGIGDTPYVIDENNVDRYPLMGPFNSFNASVGYSVDVISNSTIGDFRYFESNSTIVMHVSNMTANQTVGFCRLTIHHDVMSPPYTVKVNDTTIEYETIYENYTEGISIIYFTYEHSKLEITITPESPSSTILSLFMLTTISTILLKKKRKQN